MITDEELWGLPEDNDLAFVQFERIVKERLLEEISRLDEQSNSDPYYLEYMNKVSAAAKSYDIEVVKDIEVPGVGRHIWDAYRQFSCDVDHATTQIRIRHASRNRQHSVGLDEGTKDLVRTLIGKIRTVLDRAEIPIDKREALTRKLNAFLSEVERIRTNLQAVASLYIAVCTTIGEGAKQLEPVRKWVDSIAGLLGKAKDAEDSAERTLPKPTTPKQIEAPRTRSEKARSFDEDEIPF